MPLTVLHLILVGKGKEYNIQVSKTVITLFRIQVKECYKLISMKKRDLL